MTLQKLFCIHFNHCTELSALLIVVGFLTAMRQEVARAHKGWALDQVTLHNEVTKNIKEEVKTAPPVKPCIFALVCKE